MPLPELKIYDPSKSLAKGLAVANMKFEQNIATEKLGMARETLDFNKSKLTSSLASEARRNSLEEERMQMKRNAIKEEKIKSILEEDKEIVFGRYPINGTPEEKQQYIFDAVSSIGGRLTSEKQAGNLDMEIPEISNFVDRLGAGVTPDVFEEMAKKEGYFGEERESRNIPTDSDDYVGDMSSAWEEANPGKSAPRSKKAEWRMGYKRAQLGEVSDIATAKSNIKLQQEAAMANIKGAQAEATASGKGMGDINTEQYKAAETAEVNVGKIDTLIKHLESSDAITGMGANVFKNIERMKTLFGSKAAAGEVTDTELLDVMMGSEVFPLIKALGIGARGMDTPAEREFMRQVLTGSITLNKQTLVKMAQIRRDIAQRAIDKWNKRTDSGELDRWYSSTGQQKKKFGKSDNTDLRKLW